MRRPPRPSRWFTLATTAILVLLASIVPAAGRDAAPPPAGHAATSTSEPSAGELFGGLGDVRETSTSSTGTTGTGTGTGTGALAPTGTAAVALPAGFTDTTMWSGLLYPTAIAFAKSGRVFIAEKRGIITTYDSINDATPTLSADLRAQVFDGWDRGLLGLAADPRFGEVGHDYLYALYAADERVGGGTWNDQCLGEPDGPGYTTDGCPVTGALVRMPIGPNGVAGTPQTLLENEWCQQYSSHSVGQLAFGKDGALYVSAGDGASFQWVDYGEGGGTIIDPATGQPYTPSNPCGDPPGGVGTANVLPTGRGGSLRAQSLRRPAGEPALLNGAILRLDPETGQGMPDNPLAASPDPNARRIVAFGFRNPFRFTVRGTTLWVGDVGWRTWEEIDRMPTKPAQPSNNGWPCYEGAGVNTGFSGLAMCQDLVNATTGRARAPFFTYRHDQTTSAVDTCQTGSSSITGLAFPGSTSWPTEYHGALFFADDSRHCIWMMPVSASGALDPAQVRTFIDSTSLIHPVDLEVGPGRDLYFVDIQQGTVHRISYVDATVNRAPTAAFTADPPYGEVPLTVTFDGSASVDPDGDPLTYRWDLDGDGAFDDATGVTVQHEYAAVGPVSVRLRVQDTFGHVGKSAPVRLSPGNNPPTVQITAPTALTTWAVGETIPFAGSATDPEEGALTGSSLDWVLVIEHCPSDCHEHVVGSVGTGTTGSFVAPDHTYPSSLELRLTATDSGGLSTTETVGLDPRTVMLTFDTVPATLRLNIDGLKGRAPLVRTAIVGSAVQLTAPSPQSLNLVSYTFGHWSDGKGRTHTISAPETSRTYTATYVAAPAP